jgi:hypothetical protein
MCKFFVKYVVLNYAIVIVLFYFTFPNKNELLKHSSLAVENSELCACIKDYFSKLFFSLVVFKNMWLSFLMEC